MGLEYYSLIRSLRAINRCDIALLVTDASEFITAQDIHIAGYIKEAYKGMVLVINKWDLVPDMGKAQFVEHVRKHMKFASHVPVVFTSALHNTGVDGIMPLVMQIWEERHKQLPNSVIDKLVQDAVISHAPPRKGNRRLDIIRAYQDGINPPSFSFLVNDPALAHFSYQRYLENRIRQTFGFSGTSLRLFFKKAPRRRPPKQGERTTS
jgi:GTP-binding protein